MCAQVTGVCDNCQVRAVEMHVTIQLDGHTIRKGSCGDCLLKYVVLAELDEIVVTLSPPPMAIDLR